MPPARGEEVAIQGFYAQYLVAAELVLQRLNDPDFEYIAIKDIAAERVDDVQIISRRRVDAYQIKWNVPPRALTPSHLLGRGSASESGLFKQLVDGWKALQATHVERDVFVHLHTTSTPSVSRIDSVSSSHAPPRHLAAFLQEYWRAEHLASDVVEKWKPFAKKIQTKTGLSDGDLDRFRRHCLLDLGRRPPEDREEYVSTAPYYKDIEHLCAALLKIAAEEKGTIRLTRPEVLNLAGWGTRSEFKARHDFPVTKHYVPIESTVRQLEDSVLRFNRGYLALLGSPGSGKSTLLTTTLRYRRKMRVFRYYCFVPDDTFLSRGEAFNFLHDLVLTLWNDGIRPRHRRVGDTLEELRQTFVAQLSDIGRCWEEEKVRSIILIDGLDHINREGNPQRSLLNELPNPSAVPEGCLIVLGSQTLDRLELPLRIVQHLRNDCSARLLTMARLSRRAMRMVVNRALPEVVISADDFEAIEKLSVGHPLALSYIINRLRNSKDGGARQILRDIPAYADSIEREYEGYWEHLEGNTHLRGLLALLSRMRGVLDMKLAQQMTDAATIRDLIANAKHYFVEMPDLRWKFFHNSFRQFILDKTGRNAFGVSDAEADRAYHNQLALLAASESAPPTFRWERLYHSYQAGLLDEILQFCSQSYFREQSLASRPARHIFDDIALAMRTAKERDNAIVVIRLLLAEAEAAARADILTQTDIPALLLEIGKPDEAVKNVLHDGQLLIEPAHAIDFASELARLGNLEIAEQIFAAAEPLEKLSGYQSRGVVRGSRDILEAWVECAFLFRSMEEIKRVIDELDLADEYALEGDGIEAAKRRKVHLLVRLIDAILERGSRPEIERLPELLGDRLDKQFIESRIACHVIQSRDDAEWCGEMRDFLLHEAQAGNLSPSIRTSLIEYLLTVDRNTDEARALFANLGPPQHSDSGAGGLRGHSEHSRFLRYYRLCAALSASADPNVVVPPAERDLQRGEVLIRRMVVRLANLWGAAWRSDTLPPDAVIREIVPAVMLAETAHDRDTRLAFSGLLSWYLELMVSAAAAHGKEAVEAVEVYLGQRWERDKERRPWGAATQRELLICLFKVRRDREAVISNLADLEPQSDPYDDVLSFHENCAAQAKSWAAVGEWERAEICVRKIAQSSYGVYHDKDDQIDEWAQWTTRALIAHPDIVAPQLRQIAEGIATAAACNRGGRSNDAAITLMAAVVSEYPNAGRQMNRAFLSERVVDFLSAMKAFLLAGFRSDDGTFAISLIVLCRLHIPYARNFDSELVEAFVDGLRHISSDEMREAYLYSLLQSIERDVAPEICASWWAALDENIRGQEQLRGLHRPVAERLQRQRPQTHYTKGHIVLSDGAIVSEDELLAEARSPDALPALIESIHEDHFHGWRRVVEPVLSDLDLKQTARLCDALIGIGCSGRDLFGLLNRLRALGDEHGAEVRALRALQASRAEGWSYFFDGGSRLEPYRILVQIDSKYAKQAFHRFVDDYLQGHQAYYLTHMLDALVSVFWSEVPLNDLWLEIFEHFSHLREFSSPAIGLPEAAVACDTSRTLPSVLAEIPVNCITMPQSEVREDAYMAVCDIYRGFSDLRPQIEHAVDNLLKGRNEEPLLGLSILRGLAIEDATVVARLDAAVMPLRLHDDMAVRMAAVAIDGESITAAPRRLHKSLPPMYTMELPEFAILDHGLTSELLKPGTALPETSDPLQQIGVAEEALQLIHNRTSLPFRNLVERTAFLMKTLVSRDQWDSAAERALLDECRALRIETAYRRPRARVACLALGHVIAELYDAGKLDESDLYLLKAALAQHDLKLAGREPEGRNLSPTAPTVSARYDARLQDWVKATPEATEPLIRIGQWTILGFVTRSEAISWEEPSEFVLASVCSARGVAPDIQHNPRIIVPGTMMSVWWLAEAYPHLPYLASALEQSLLIRGQASRLEFGGASWLALNPLVGTKLGWNLVDSGLFRWADGRDEVMVESLWWRNGRLDRHPPGDGVRSEGWLVVATSAGIDQLRRSWSPAVWAQGSERTIKAQDDTIVKSWATVTPLS